MAKSRILVVNNRTGASLADYQVRVDLTGHNFDFFEATPDGSDIRITQEGSNDSIPYWREAFDAINQWAVIWFKATLAPGESLFRLRYGDGISYADDPSAVFAYYNALSEQADLDALDGATGSGTWSVETAAGSPTGKAVQGLISSEDASRYIAQAPPADHIVELHFADVNAGDPVSWGGAMMRYQDDTHWYHAGAAPDSAAATENDERFEFRWQQGGAATQTQFWAFDDNWILADTFHKQISIDQPRINLVGSTDVALAGYAEVLQGASYYAGDGKLYISTNEEISRVTTAGTVEENVVSSPAAGTWGDTFVKDGRLHAVRAGSVSRIYDFDPDDIASGPTLTKDLASDLDTGAGPNGLTFDGTYWLVGETQNSPSEGKRVHVFNESWTKIKSIKVPDEGDLITHWGIQSMELVDDQLYIANHNGEILVGGWNPTALTISLHTLIRTGLADLQGIAWDPVADHFVILDRNVGLLQQQMLQRTFAADVTSRLLWARWNEPSEGDAISGVFPFMTDTESSAANRIGIGAFRDGQFSQMTIRKWAFPEPVAMVGERQLTSGDRGASIANLRADDAVVLRLLSQ